MVVMTVMAVMTDSLLFQLPIYMTQNNTSSKMYLLREILEGNK